MKSLNVMKFEESFDSDLAMERKKASTYVEGVDFTTETNSVGRWERIGITSEAGERLIGRPMGQYDTLTLPFMESILPEDIEDAKDEIARELCNMCDMNDISPERIMVVGLGNRELSPDAIGSYAADEVEATMHIRKANEKMFTSLGCSEICVIHPGVAADTGISTAKTVKSTAQAIKPTLIIAIDSLASRSDERLGNTIQISNTGIIPGKGVGHSGAVIDERLTGAPVIAIGVPTVVSSSVFGVKKGRHEMLVCPKGINKIVKNAAKIIGGGINQAFGICYF